MWPQGDRADLESERGAWHLLMTMSLFRPLCLLRSVQGGVQLLSAHCVQMRKTRLGEALKGCRTQESRTGAEAG